MCRRGGRAASTDQNGDSVHDLMQGQYQNDLRGLVFDNQVPGLPKISGEFILEYVFQIDTHRSKWTNLGVLFSMIVVYRIIFFFMIKISEDVTPWLRGYIARRRLRQKSVGIENVHQRSSKEYTTSTKRWNNNSNSKKKKRQLVKVVYISNPMHFKASAFMPTALENLAAFMPTAASLCYEHRQGWPESGG